GGRGAHHIRPVQGAVPRHRDRADAPPGQVRRPPAVRAPGGRVAPMADRRLSSSSAAPPLFGLVLAGGRSTRMGRDKAALTYADGTPQLERAMRLLAPHVARAFVSVRSDQADDPVRARFAQIRDREENLGPIAGLLAAQAQHPEVRSEEHTSELQSRFDLVCRLLLEKKKQKKSHL